MNDKMKIKTPDGVVSVGDKYFAGKVYSVTKKEGDSLVNSGKMVAVKEK